MKMSKGSRIFTKNINGLLSLIYPRPCLICQSELPENQNHFCFLCLENLHFTDFEKYKESTSADELFWGRVKIQHVYSCLFFEKGNSTQQILHTIKYKEGKDLGVYMGELIGKRIKDNENYKSIDALIPIPLHSKKGFVRGYNQSMVIAQGLSNILEIPIINAVKRKNHHESQTKKNRFERWDNVKSVFAADQDKLKGYKHVAIVDDVLTTGSTLESAARSIKNVKPDQDISLLTVAIAK
ncbi:MAG: amidophosphoribosyltransferase [Fluviicola sp.]|nr:MAG: amidophosphoribosyltransferase [Fluviicola sp.]